MLSSSRSVPKYTFWAISVFRPWEENGWELTNKSSTIVFPVKFSTTYINLGSIWVGPTLQVQPVDDTLNTFRYVLIFLRKMIFMKSCLLTTEKQGCREECFDWNILWHDVYRDEVFSTFLLSTTLEDDSTQPSVVSSETSHELKNCEMFAVYFAFAILRSVTGSMSIVPKTPATLREYHPISLPNS